MKNRSAEASIKGYNYQFIHSIINILERNENDVVTIEGIEDLDISTAEGTNLYQYKYHEFADYKKSLMAKPIALMYNHYLKNRKMNIKYKLLIYLKSDLPNLTIGELKAILKLKTATDYLDEELIEYSTEDYVIEAFLECFSWSKAIKYEEIENNILKEFKKIFSVSHDEALVVFLPNAIRIINSLGIQSSLGKRKITPRKFKDLLSSKKEVSDLAYIHRVYGEDRAKSDLIKRLKSLNIKKNNSDKIIYLENINRHNISALLINIIKRHFYKGNKSDFRPIIIIAKDSKGIKKCLYDYIKEINEVIIMNDGFEDYCFNIDIFNNKPIMTTLPQRGKVNDTSYNFKLISLETYIKYDNQIKLVNPVLYCLDELDPQIIEKHSNVILLSSLSNNSIIDTMGGLYG